LPGRDLVELAVWPGPSAHPGRGPEESDGAEDGGVSAGWHWLGVVVLFTRHEWYLALVLAPGAPPWRQLMIRP